ncbi:MAG: hypothetical protein WC747_01955 [Candidatus Babeliales bacterium]|jgi:hypothetical protein
MDQVQNKKFVGYFLKRNDLYKLSVVELLRELSNHLFEAQIMKLAIQHFQEKKLYAFDSSVGDWKCQTRTSMIIDLAQDSTFIEQSLPKELDKISTLIFHLEQLLQKINNFNSIEAQNLSRHLLQKISLNDYLAMQHIDYDPLDNTKFLSLCFLTTYQNNKFSVFTEHQMSLNKFKAVINAAKTMLCHLSINYEKKLAELYGSTNEQKALLQIETKSVQRMTALFSGFQSIFKKMKLKQQPFITNNIIFCGCGGIQIIQNKFFAIQNNEFIETTAPTDTQQEITVIDVYQFPGSLEKLQNIFGALNSQSGFPKEFYKSCNCTQPTQQQPIKSIELAIMAFFAQHPQFTNGASIDWEGLDLVNSDLKNNFDALRSLSGYSCHDMSKFQINHMYPSTIGHVLQSTDIKSLTSDVNFCGIGPDCLK